LDRLCKKYMVQFDGFHLAVKGSVMYWLMPQTPKLSAIAMRI